MKNREPVAAPRILIADDSNVAQRMGKEILAAEGYNVLTVSNGQAAIKKLKEFMPDLILADIFMPGANGYELCQIVRADADLGYVPVVLLVGAMEPYDQDEARRAKADAVITKPLQSSNLLGIVKNLLAAAAAPVGVHAGRADSMAEVAPAVAGSSRAVEEAPAIPTFVEPAESWSEEPVVGAAAALAVPEESDLGHSPFEMELQTEPATTDMRWTASQETAPASEPEPENQNDAGSSEASMSIPSETFPEETPAGQVEASDNPISLPIPDLTAAKEAFAGIPAASAYDRDFSNALSALEGSFADLALPAGLLGTLPQDSPTTGPAAVALVASLPQEPVAGAELPPPGMQAAISGENPFGGMPTAAAQVWIAEQVDVTEEDRKLFESVFPDWDVLTKLVQARDAEIADSEPPRSPAGAAETASTESSEPAAATAALGGLSEAHSEDVHSDETRSEAARKDAYSVYEEPSVADGAGENRSAPAIEAAMAAAATPAVWDAGLHAASGEHEANGEMERHDGSATERESARAEEPFPLSPPPEPGALDGGAESKLEQSAEPRITVDRTFVEQLVRDSLESMMPEIVDRLVRSVETAIRKAEQ